MQARRHAGEEFSRELGPCQLLAVNFIFLDKERSTWL
jgi:hypothetical protein